MSVEGGEDPPRDGRRGSLQAFWSYSCRQELSGHCTKSTVLIRMRGGLSRSLAGPSGTWKCIQGWPRDTRVMVRMPASVSTRLV